MKAVYLFNNQNNTEIISNKMYFVDDENVIHVDRSTDENTDDFPKNTFRVRSHR